MKAPIKSLWQNVQENRLNTEAEWYKNRCLGRGEFEIAWYQRNQPLAWQWGCSFHEVASAFVTVKMCSCKAPEATSRCWSKAGQRYLLWVDDLRGAALPNGSLWIYNTCKPSSWSLQLLAIATPGFCLKDWARKSLCQSWLGAWPRGIKHRSGPASNEGDMHRAVLQPMLLHSYIVYTGISLARAVAHKPNSD